jgi:hypothetical protein
MVGPEPARSTNVGMREGARVGVGVGVAAAVDSGIGPGGVGVGCVRVACTVCSGRVEEDVAGATFSCRTTPSVQLVANSHASKRSGVLRILVHLLVA